MTITYTAIDGKVFTDKDDCEKYEDMLKLLGSTYNEIHNFVSNLKGYDGNIWMCKETLEEEPHCGQDLPSKGETIHIMNKKELHNLLCLDGLLEKYDLKKYEN